MISARYHYLSAGTEGSGSPVPQVACTHYNDKGTCLIMPRCEGLKAEARMPAARTWRYAMTVRSGPNHQRHCLNEDQNVGRHGLRRPDELVLRAA